MFAFFENQDNSAIRSQSGLAAKNQDLRPNALDYKDNTGSNQAAENFRDKSIGRDFSRVNAFDNNKSDSRNREGKTTDSRQNLPKIKISGFSKSSSALQKDKNLNDLSGDQDESITVTTLAENASGVDIIAEIAGAMSSVDYPDGYRWTQTVTTNKIKGAATLLATPTTYVDPTPNDDAKPFYYTDAEESASGGVFVDHPSRNPLAAGTIEWDAVLALNGVNGNTVTSFDSVGYGFSLDSATGKVTLHGAISQDLTNHHAALSKEFPAWTFN